MGDASHKNRHMHGHGLWAAAEHHLLEDWRIAWLLAWLIILWTLAFFATAPAY